MQFSRRQACTTLGALLSLPAFSAARTIARPNRRRPGAGAPDPAAFLEAVKRGDLERVRELLAEDATLATAKDDVGRSAFVLANVHGREDVAAELQATGITLDIVEAVMAEDWGRFNALATAHPELLRRAHPVGGTPLYAAALVASRDSWRMRSKGCEPDAAPDGGTGYTPARGAMECVTGTWARISVADLCANGSDVNARQRGGSSVLHGAVLRRDPLLVRLAIRKGAAVDAKDDEGRTARALADELGWEAGERLLAGHASLPRDNRASRFALDANREPIVRPDLSDVSRDVQGAVTGSSHTQLDKVRELVSKDERLVFSISTDDELAIEACAHIGTRDIIRYHLDHGAPLSLPTAVSAGDFESVEFWLQRDATLIHERGAHDFPVMWYTLLGGAGHEMAELLTMYGASVDQESTGTTTLHWCMLRGDLDLAKWLLENGADPTAVGYNWSRDGETPLQIAQQRGNAKAQAMLRAAGA